MTTTTPATHATETPTVLTPGTIGPLTLRNRVIKAATYEGLSHRGKATTDLRDFHLAFARGGVGMTTVAYCAVSADGRTDKHQIHWQDEALPGLAALTRDIHVEGAAIAAQIGHSGPVGHPKVNKAPTLAPSPTWNKTAVTNSRACTLEDIARVTEDFAEATRRAVEVGFDSVEVHLGHNYLLSSFLSPKINKREDAYGGTLERRARFAREVMQAVYAAAAGQIAVTAKVNMEDGYRGGFTIPESIQFVRWLEEDGTVDALEMTVGSSLQNPMYLFKGEAPIKQVAAVMPQPIRMGVRMAGRVVLKKYPWEENYLLAESGKVRAATSLPMIALGGITGRPSMDLAMRSGFEFVAIGRELLRQPDLVNRVAADPGTPGMCDHCNRCMPTNFTGTRCVTMHPESPRGATWGKPEGYLA